jgi:hypothetical protein
MVINVIGEYLKAHDLKNVGCVCQQLTRFGVKSKQVRIWSMMELYNMTPSMRASIGMNNIHRMAHVGDAEHDIPADFKTDFPKLKWVRLGWDFNYPLRVDCFPVGLQTLIIGERFNHVISKNQLPESLKHLDMRCIPVQLDVTVLPKNLHTLQVPDTMNSHWQWSKCVPMLHTLQTGTPLHSKPLHASFFPNQLRVLTLHWRHQGLLDINVLPATVTKLCLMGNFQQPIVRHLLPRDLICLQLPEHFNCTLGIHVLPTGLRTLKLGNAFNQLLVKGVFPTRMRKLVFGDNFTGPLETGVLPASLRSLRFGARFNQEFCPGDLPPLLHKITLADGYRYDFTPDVLPAFLEHFELGHGFDDLSFQPGWMHEGIVSVRITRPLVITAGVFPSTLRMLYLEGFNHVIRPGTFSEGLESLHLGAPFDQPLLPNGLPRSIHTLSFGSTFKHKLRRTGLPAKLRKLVLGTHFNVRITAGQIPTTLQSLSLPGTFDKSFKPGVLIEGLVELLLGTCFNQPIHEGVLPKSLQRLELGHCFNQVLLPGAFPSRLGELRLRNFDPNLGWEYTNFDEYPNDYDWHKHVVRPVTARVADLPHGEPIGSYLIPALLRGLSAQQARSVVASIQSRLPPDLEWIFMENEDVS